MSEANPLKCHKFIKNVFSVQFSGSRPYNKDVFSEAKQSTLFE